MSIEGLGKKFQEARLARNLTLDEAARMTKIRPSRLAEIEADDFSNFPSLAYAKGFVLIYGKFLDVDVSPYMEVFETSEQVTVDGYSYLQDNPPPKPARVRAPVIRPAGRRASLTPFLIGVVLLVVGFSVMKLLLNLQRISPRTEPEVQATPPPVAQVTSPTIAPPTATPAATAVARATPAETPPSKVAAAPTIPPAPTIAPTATPPPPTPPPVAIASPPATKEPEIRRAEAVRPADLAKAAAEQQSPAAAEGGNRVAIRPLKRTYIKVVVDNEAQTPAFERWISPADGTVEFRGQHIAIRVLDRDAVQIRKNGKPVPDGDSDVLIE